MTADGTVDPAEIARFAALADTWWAPSGPFAPLHRLNPLRVGYIRDTVAARRELDQSVLSPLEGLRVLDVGCGGGILAEPLARLGGAVLGIDAGVEAIEAARAHAAATGTDVAYRHTTIEALADTGERFDVVTAMEIVEHVADLDLFLGACSRVLAPDGTLFFSTVNRTAKSWAAAIVAAEWILRWLPRGTHDWKRFPRPSELHAALGRQGLKVGGLTGLIWRPDGFRLAPHDLDVNYMGWAAPAGG